MKIAISGKGGVGKTTFASFLVRALADQGKKVLAIDADPDANLAQALGVPGGAEMVPISEMKDLIDATAEDLAITQDLGLGMMLWMTQFFPGEAWAQSQRRRSLAMLDRVWMPEGYFCREPNLPDVRIAFANYGVSVGLQAVKAMPKHVARLNAYFDAYRSWDEYDREAITHVMSCSSHFPGLLLQDQPGP